MIELKTGAQRPPMAALAAGLALLLAAAAEPAQAQAARAAQASAADDAPGASGAAADDQIQALRMESHASRRQLEDQQAEIDELRLQLRDQMAILRRAGLVETSSGGQDRPIIRVADQPAPAQPTTQPPPTTAPASAGATTERPRSERQADQLLVDAGGVLLPRWTLQMEPSFGTTHVSNPRVNIFGYTVFNAINIGTIRVDDISQDVLESAISLRLGLPFRTQIDVRIPHEWSFVRQTEGIGTGNITELDTRGNHIGDVQATFSWQPVTERGWRPAVVLRTRVGFPTGESVFAIPQTYPPQQNGAETQLTRAPTGAGYYTVEPGFTLVWRSDPLVLFVGGSYADTLPTRRYTSTLFNPTPPANTPATTIVDHGRIDTGNVAQFNVGVNFAVNERASLNFSFIDLYAASTKHQVTGSATWDRVLGTATNDARLGLGASFGLTDNIALVVNAGVGLTDQSPGYTFGVSLPITLPLRRR